MTQVEPPAWSVHLSTAGCTCIRFTCDRVRDSDPWLLSRAVSELVAGGASLGDRPRALGTGRGIPLIHSQMMSWQGTTFELEAHHLRDKGNDEVSVTLPPWDELAGVVAHEDDVWEMLDTVAAAITPRFGIIGDGEAIGLDRSETHADLRVLLRRHTGIITYAYATHPPDVIASAYRDLPRSRMIAFIR